MACETITADEAKQIGLVHQVYPSDVFADKVMEFAQRLAGLPRRRWVLPR